MAKVLVILASSSEVKDFYKHFKDSEMKRTMGWQYAYTMCDPDTERPSKEICSEIMKVSGLSNVLIGDFSHFLGEFILAEFVDYENYELPKDFVVTVCSDDADGEKLKVFSTLKGFDIAVYEITATDDNFKELYKILELYLNEEVSKEEIFNKLGWKNFI